MSVVRPCGDSFIAAHTLGVIVVSRPAILRVANRAMDGNSDFRSHSLINNHTHRESAKVKAGRSLRHELFQDWSLT